MPSPLVVYRACTIRLLLLHLLHVHDLISMAQQRVSTSASHTAIQCVLIIHVHPATADCPPPLFPIPPPLVNLDPVAPPLQAWSGMAASPPGRACGMPSRQCGHPNGTPGLWPACARQDCSTATSRWLCCASLSFPPSTLLWRTPPTQSQVQLHLASCLLQTVLQQP